MDNVTEIHRKLNYTDEEAEDLKKIKLVWSKLEVARKKAKDPRYLDDYCDLLTKSLAQIRKFKPLDDIEGEARKFWDWYADQTRELDVAERELRRGQPHQEWAEKHLEKEWKAFETAYGHFVDLPSEQKLKECRFAATALLKAYVGAFS